MSVTDNPLLERNRSMGGRGSNKAVFVSGLRTAELDIVSPCCGEGLYSAFMLFDVAFIRLSANQRVD